MPRCKFSHVEEEDPCSGNETKMYLETAIAERQTSFPSIHSGTLNLPAAPSLLLFSLCSHYPSPRYKNLRSILRYREGGGRKAKFWRVFSFEQAKRQKSGHRFTMSKLAKKKQSFATILQFMATEIKTKVQFDFMTP
jgi:hypothetical protein